MVFSSSYNVNNYNYILQILSITFISYKQKAILQKEQGLLITGKKGGKSLKILPSKRIYTILEYILKIKFDTLCQRQFITIVNRIGLTTHVLFPRVGARFSATASFFFTTKCSTNFST